MRREAKQNNWPVIKWRYVNVNKLSSLSLLHYMIKMLPMLHDKYAPRHKLTEFENTFCFSHTSLLHLKEWHKTDNFPVLQKLPHMFIRGQEIFLFIKGIYLLYDSFTRGNFLPAGVRTNQWHSFQPSGSDQPKAGDGLCRPMRFGQAVLLAPWPQYTGRLSRILTIRWESCLPSSNLNQ